MITMTRMVYKEIIRPVHLDGLSYGIDLIQYYRNTNRLKLIGFDPESISRTNDFVVFQDKIEPIYLVRQRLEHKLN